MGPGADCVASAHFLAVQKSVQQASEADCIRGAPPL